MQCSFIFNQIVLKQGVIWACNETFLKVLKDKVGIRPFSDRHFEHRYPIALYYLARVSKFSAIKANREKVLKQIEKFNLCA